MESRLLLAADLPVTNLGVPPSTVGHLGDLDQDGFVRSSDLAIILDNWAMTVPPGQTWVDPTGNGVINAFDLALILDNWGAEYKRTLTFQEGGDKYSGTKDTYVNKSQPDREFGEFDVVFIDKFTPTAHGLLKFDGIFSNGLNQIPLGSSIGSATLTLNVENTGGARRLCT